MDDSLFLPTEIPWKDLKGKELEELLYWLFDAMGAKDLEWRIGGTNSGTADQGRDLELSFYSSSPDGELVRQKWWVEAKGRKRTVEPEEVKSAVLNVAGKSGIDVMVVATNSAFSNPTRDWVKEWQQKNPLPKIKLWERTELENYCSKHPIAVIRVFRHALNPAGKLAVLTTKLWDYSAFTDEFTLKELWKERERLKINFKELVALIACELANGDIMARSWGMIVDEEKLVESLGNALLNLLFLIFRSEESGLRQEPLIRGMAYLVLLCTTRVGADFTANLLSSVWDQTRVKFPDQIRNMALEPIMRVIHGEVRDVCTSDCSRISTQRTMLSESEVSRYWDRLRVKERTPERLEPRPILTIEKYDGACKVGFALNKEVSCPLCDQEEPQESISEVLHVIETVAKVRCKQKQ
jgi:hypothetical protein